MLKVGIIGCGSIARFCHFPEYAELAREGLVRIVKAYDVVMARAEEMGTKYQSKACKDYMEILNDPEIEAVSVCVPNYLHAKITMEALSAGKHVLCEKPIATSLKEAEAMIKAAKNSGKKLMVAQSQRFALAHKKAKEIIDSGVLGRILTFETAFAHGGPEGWSIEKSKSTWFFSKEKAAFGVMGDLGIHKADLIQYLLGEKIIEVGAFMDTLAKTDRMGSSIEIEDNAVCILKMASGAIGKMAVSWTLPLGEVNYTRLYCQDGILRIYDDSEYALIVTKNDGEGAYYKLGAIFNNEDPKPTGMIRGFVDSIINDSLVPVTAEDAYQALKVILACKESAETGRMIKIE